METKIKDRTAKEIINSINELLGFSRYEDTIKWSHTKKDELLKLEEGIKRLKMIKGEEIR